MLFNLDPANAVNVTVGVSGSTRSSSQVSTVTYGKMGPRRDPQSGASSRPMGRTALEEILAARVDLATHSMLDPLLKTTVEREAVDVA